MKTLSRILLAFAATLALCLPALAQDSEDPAVAAAKSANTAIAACVGAITQGAASADNSVKALLITQAPSMCRQSVVMPNIRQAPTAGEMLWDGTKFALQLWAGYKGQALMWSGITSLVNRQADSTDNAVNQGFNTANASIGTIGGLAGQAQSLIPAPEPAVVTTPAVTP